ncbi:FAD/NAD(P)-binding domain-containing protein [Dendrothele bispora CBS 962.96]|uniref:FAD/NAD(P)-binding domain-containing protein n=1 Tax=Dendrothele bispora (strain CBS 962.96) TaxID=1314807 RepID=A0A4S8KQI5_DENBC|nr:FAD/NAD(P)-binding domain-containing protein [Dendrothele bispora CBS 962.96]
MQTPELPVRPKRILIIGGGPAGLVTLRNFIELGTFERVELVERRDDVGNVLLEFLSYHGFPFPPPAEYDRENRQYQPFPTLTEMHNYLKAFAKPFIEDGRLRLGKEVVKVEERPLPNDSRDVKDKWRVVLRDWANPIDPDKEVEELWDAVVVCVGWYDNPIWPETQGLDEVREKGLAKHAKGWRGPEGWEGKRTLVIGNANSSNDIAAQLAAYVSTSSPIYRSIRRPNFPGFVTLPDERIEGVQPPVKRYTLLRRPY